MLLGALAFVGGCNQPADAPTWPIEYPAPGLASSPIQFDIGGTEPDPHSHVSFHAPKGLVRASVWVSVRKYAPKGINFFALEVTFPNKTWSHGGFQTKSLPSGNVPGHFNWCGLVNRGGGSADYTKADLTRDLDQIQCSADHPYDWRPGVVYEYVVERGNLITLPPGVYGQHDVSPGQVVTKTTGSSLYAKHYVDHPRTMWQWRFTVRPVSAPGAAYEQTIYVNADTISSFMVWNEHGTRELFSTWMNPTFRTAEAPGVTQVPSKWSRF